MKRLPYEPARQILVFSLGYTLIAMFRFLGVIEVEHELATLVLFLDSAMLSAFILSFCYSVYAIFHNAKLEASKNDSAR